MRPHDGITPWPFDPLVPLSYKLIVADPPWPWITYSDKGAKKSPSAHYETMTMAEIKTLPVLDLATSPTLLLLWGTVPRLPEQIEVMRAWGFRYQSAMVWHKVFASGKNAIGTGHRVRSMAELVLIGTLGKPKHKAFPGLFRGIRREHSRKPEEFYDLIDEKAYDLWPRCDLFGRQSREGWAVFGKEATKFDAECA